jgi:hypothetical protein
MSTPSQRRIYSTHWQQINAFVCQVCGIKLISEAEWIAADLTADTNKSEKTHERECRTALCDQINTQEKVGI